MPLSACADIFCGSWSDTGHYPAVRDRHFVTLNNMVLVNLIQSFERFIKDLAAVCVDHLFDRTIDGRFDEPQVRGSSLAAHFAGSSPGKALCESGVWLDCKGINERFKDYLRHPTDAHSVFHVFAPNSDTFRIMNLIWQLRHTIVHNVGVITRSDAAKLRLLAKKKLSSPRILLPTSDDLRFLQAYLDSQVKDINKRAGERLAAILTVIHASDPTLFAPAEEADAISKKFDDLADGCRSRGDSMRRPADRLRAGTMIVDRGCGSHGPGQ